MGLLQEQEGREERVSDEDWEVKIRPNLASMPTEELVALSQSMRTKNFNKTLEILSRFLKKEGVPQTKEGIEQFDK